MTNKPQNIALILIQAATVAVFAGRAWQHLFWDAPFRTLLWDEGWMKGIVKGVFGMQWQNYITSMEVDSAIQSAIKGTGVFYLFCALLALFIRKLPKWLGKVLLLGALSLLILAALYCKEKFFSLGQFFEYALQVSSPVFLYQMVYRKVDRERLVFYMKVATALTFICHGLYAINFYPRPGLFVEMFINTLGTKEETAHTLLAAAGILDFVASAALFLPLRYARPAALYMALWGLATALARITSFFDASYALESMNQWMHETVFRFPHFLIPLAMWYLMGILSKRKEEVFYSTTTSCLLPANRPSFSKRR